MSTKVWNLMYRLGTTGRVIGDAENPQTRRSALDGAKTITNNAWRVWIEHHTSGKILYRNPTEVEFQQSLVAKRAIEFAEANVIASNEWIDVQARLPDSQQFCDWLFPVTDLKKERWILCSESMVTASVPGNASHWRAAHALPQCQSQTPISQVLGNIEVPPFIKKTV